MNKLKVVVDVDCTLWNFNAPLLQWLNKFYGMPIEQARDWGWYKKYISDKEFYRAVDVVHARQMEYKPFSGAQSFFASLNTNKGIEIWIASHRKLGSAPALASWLEKYDLGPYSGLYTGPNKLQLLSAGDILIDDAPHTVTDAKKMGVQTLVPAWPWNRDIEGWRRYQNLEGIARAVSILLS